MNNEWISIGEKLPPIGEWVLASTVFGQEVMFLKGLEPVFETSDSRNERNVTHWTPLPPNPLTNEKD